MELHIIGDTQDSCTIIRHGDGRVSMVDICSSIDRAGGKSIQYLRDILAFESKLARLVVTDSTVRRVRGLWKVCQEVGFFNLWHNDLLPRLTSSLDDDGQLFYDLVLGKSSYECNVVPVTAGYSTNLCSLEVLSPSTSLLKNCGERLSEASIVLFGVTDSGKKILIVGDIGFTAWREMASDRVTADKLLSVDIMVLHSLDTSWIPLCKNGLILPRVIVCRNLPTHVDFADIMLLEVASSGAVVMEDCSDGVNIYSSDRSMAAGQFQVVRKHPKYNAWLCGSV